MKNIFKFLGIFTLIILIGFSLTACSDGSGGTHTHIPGAAATCTTAQTCTDCGEVLQKASGHDWEQKGGNPATCVATGTGKRDCKVCGEKETGQLAIDPNNHAWGTTKEAKPATCTAEGNTVGKECTRGCGTTTGTVIAKLEHDFDHDICTQCHSIKMIYVEGGSFVFTLTKPYGTEIVGSSLETVDSFYIGKYEVTQDLWNAVMGTNPSYFQGADTDKVVASGEEQGKRPVEKVAFYTMLNFCNKLSEREGLTPAYQINSYPYQFNPDTTGYRLPMARQWEFAAKGGKNKVGYTWTDSDTYFKHSGSDNPDEVAWYKDKATAPFTDARTHEVGKLAPNELGICDMSGNVSEFCWDNPSALFHIVFGGSYLDIESGCYSVSQIWGDAQATSPAVGFRVVLPK